LGGVAKSWIESVVNDTAWTKNCSSYPKSGFDLDARDVVSKFNEFDANNDQKLSKKEVQRLVKDDHALLPPKWNEIKKQWQQFDASKD